MRNGWKVLPVLGAVFLSGCGSGNGPMPVSPDDSRKLIGGGSTFVYPVMNKWTSEFYKATGKEINYQSLGSGGGVKQFSVGTLDFGATDAPMNASQLEEAHDPVVHIPVVLGAVVVSYNLPDVKTSLTLSGQLISDIYLKNIRKWNNPAIRKLNPNVNLPDADIVTVRRADSSGTTYVFADFLARSSTNWREKMGVGNGLEWPGDAIGAKGNEGVSAQLKRTRNSIGYIELIYSIEAHMPAAKIISADGEPVEPSVDSVTAAGTSLKSIPPDLRMSLTYSPGKNAYPIAGMTWVVARSPMHNPEKAKLLTEFLNYVLSDKAQSLVKNLNYSRLPKSLLEKSRAMVGKISPQSQISE